MARLAGLSHLARLPHLAHWAHLAHDELWRAWRAADAPARDGAFFEGGAAPRFKARFRCRSARGTPISVFAALAPGPAISPRLRVCLRARAPDMAPKLDLRRVRKLAMKAARPPQSQTHLDAFARGVIWGMYVAGLPRADMATHIQKPHRCPTLSNEKGARTKSIPNEKGVTLTA